MTTNDPPPSSPEDEYEKRSVARQLRKAIADEAENRKFAAGSKKSSDKRYYQERAAFYGRMANELERRLMQLSPFRG